MGISGLRDTYAGSVGYATQTPQYPVLGTGSHSDPDKQGAIGAHESLMADTSITGTDIQMDS